MIREDRRALDDTVDTYQWDLIQGWQRLEKTADGIWMWKPIEVNEPAPAGQPPRQGQPQPDPHSALRQIWNPRIGLSAFGDREAVFYLKDFHRWFKDIPVCRRALSIKEGLKGAGKTVVFIAPNTEIPSELRNDIQVVEFKYPDEGTLRNILGLVCEDNKLSLPDNAEQVVEAMLGFTSEAAENALAFSLASKGMLDIRTILDMKAAYLKAGGVLLYGRYAEKLEDLYGLEYMKRFVLATIHNPKARGIIIYGVPGTGKSHFAKAIANFVQRVLLTAKFSGIRGRYQGEAETRVKEMFQTVEAFGRPIVFADEFEKSISGTGSSDTDGGVGQRILGETLTYMQDRPRGGAYWIVTVNDVDEILHLSGGALLRRFDAMFFCDLPTREECQGIAKIWNRIEGVSIPMDWDFTGYTGADIAKLATHMSMMGCGPEEARKFIIPYGEANGDELATIREKAKKTCLPASSPEGFVPPPAAPKRKVQMATPSPSVKSHLH